MIINREYKDRLFTKLFGSQECRENLLSLFNALNNTCYTDSTDIEITTIDDVIYMGIKNDFSCILDGYMILGEHQSTFNPNMPLRGLLYFAKLYEQHIAKYGINVYSKRLQKIPTPQYFVFYNGPDDLPDRITLKLSDAFIHKAETTGHEWTATMLNINLGHNEELIDNRRTLVTSVVS